MAVFSIADMGSQLPTVYRKKLTLTQRKTPTLRLFADFGMLNQGTTGQKMTWQVKTSGQVAGNTNLDGGAFLTAASDVPNNVAIEYGTYEAPCKVTDDILWKGQAAAGVSADYSTFTNVVSEARVDAIAAALKLMEQQIYSGTGSTQQMTGLYIGVATGAYGTLTNSEWVATVTENGGVLRNATITLLKTMARTIAVASNGGRPNLALCPPAMMDILEALFDPFLQMPIAPAATGTPQKERAIMNPGTIRTIGGDIKVDGFRVLHWASGGLYFVEAPDVVNSASTNTTAGLYMLDTDAVAVDYLPPPGQRIAAPDAQAVQAIEQNMGPIAQIPFESISRGRIAHAGEWDMTAKVGLKVLDRRATGWLGDLQ